jgi:tetratricopeptide (TPR) repeat protein
MDEKKRQDKKNNVILFPNLSDRLVDKGLERLEQRDFKKAAEWFYQARELDPEHPEMNMGLLVSLVEMGMYEEGKKLCKKMLMQGMGDYFQIINIYLMILLHLNDHEEIIVTIEALIEEHHIPIDQADHFDKMLQFSRKAFAEKETENYKSEQHLQTEQEKSPLFENKTDQEILANLTKLADTNIRPYAREIEAFLLKEAAHPFFKTLLLNIMHEQEFDREIEVKKFGKSILINPAHYLPLKESLFLQRIKMLVEQQLSQENPTLLEMIIDLIERQFFILYPFEPEMEQWDTWAAAYHVLAEEYQSGEYIMNEAVERYEVSSESILNILPKIREIEELSYMNI